LYLYFMKAIRFLLILMLSTYTFNSMSQKLDTSKLVDFEAGCEHNWQYFNLDQKITGKLIAYKPDLVFCGTVITASSAIIVTPVNDTIRILNICDVGRKFIKSDLVEVIPADKPVSNVMVFSDELYCYIKKTYYGYITKVN